jgi:hypothetical protein
MTTGTNPFKEQVGGNHYKEMKFQPITFILANGLGFCEGNAIKYICRYKTKNGIEDLKKAIHYLELLIEMEKKNDDMEREWKDVDDVCKLDRRVPAWNRARAGMATNRSVAESSDYLYELSSKRSAD